MALSNFLASSIFTSLLRSLGQPLIYPSLVVLYEYELLGLLYDPLSGLALALLFVCRDDCDLPIGSCRHINVGEEASAIISRLHLLIILNLRPPRLFTGRLFLARGTLPLEVFFRTHLEGIEHSTLLVRLRQATLFFTYK